MDTSNLSTDAEANHDASIMSTVGVFFFLSITATGLRSYSRKMKGISSAVDDFLIFLSLTLAIAENIMYAYGVRKSSHTLPGSVDESLPGAESKCIPSIR